MRAKSAKTPKKPVPWHRAPGLPIRREGEPRTVNVDLGIKEWSQALDLAKTGTEPCQDWTDRSEAGLRIRVRGRSASWLLKVGNRTQSLGPVRRWTPKQVRDLCPRVRAKLKSGLDPQPWLDAVAAGLAFDDADKFVQHRKARQEGAWDLETTLRNYLAYLRIGRLVRGRQRPPSWRTARDIEATLAAEPFRAIAGMLAQELNEGDLEDFRNAMKAAHRSPKGRSCKESGSRSRKALANVKAALSWARKYHPAAAGLKGMQRWWRDIQSDHADPPRTRMPSVADLGMTLALAEAAQAAPGQPGREKSVAALALTVVTLLGQRREMVGVEHRFIVEDKRMRKGWGIIFLPAELMKSKHDHALPLPPALMQLLRPAIAAATKRGSKYLFPAARKGKAEVEVPMNESTLNQLLRRLRGKDEIGRKCNAPDLFLRAKLSVPDWSPQDLRRTFATVVEDETTRGDSVSAVLDHAQDGERNDPRDAAAITRIAYSQSQRLKLKRIAVRLWVPKILAAIAKARPHAKALVADARHGTLSLRLGKGSPIEGASPATTRSDVTSLPNRDRPNAASKRDTRRAA
jgi:integrase